VRELADWLIGWLIGMGDVDSVYSMGRGGWLCLKFYRHPSKVAELVIKNYLWKMFCHGIMIQYNVQSYSVMLQKSLLQALLCTSTAWSGLPRCSRRR
jgi:hypothetical protein